MKAVREQTADAEGRPIVAGVKVTVAGEDGPQDGTVVRILDDYGVLTVVVSEGRGRAERMYRITDVEVA